MTQDFAQKQLFQAREQFRMVRLQVFNWGTFDKLHTVPIAEKGFLFVGRSGSGKTTLLDAISALLVPPRWVNFNAAAQDTEQRGRDRSLASYIRGAWAEQKDGGSGELATQYLRSGTTWSGLALIYRNTDGRVITLVQLLWIRGAGSSPGDVRRHHMILERPFDLKELEDFDLNLRRLKQSLPQAFHAERFSAYSERFQRLFSIENEMALRLLHKTQSAKNLGDLNTFLRDFMLDRPRTFDVAETLVTEFAELDEAHRAVVTAREQVRTLAPARDAHARLQGVVQALDTLESLRRAVDPYRELRRVALLEERIAALHVRAEGLAGEITAQEQGVENLRGDVNALEARHRQLGGGRIEELERDRRDFEAQCQERVRRRAQAQDACRQLGWELPASAPAFAEMTGRAREELAARHALQEAQQAQLERLIAQKQETEAAFKSAQEEVEALRRQPSNIPAKFLELRRGLAAALALPEEVLPFAGELIEVKPAQAEWRGAIERVLHGFAISLLVDERHYAQLSKHVNAQHLGERLVYLRTSAHSGAARTVDLKSLVRKLDLKEGPHRAWLEFELQARFNYSCADSLREFRQYERAVTREGQVRHGRHRHEKDDRRHVDDPRFWVLGFDNRDKRALFEQQAAELGARLSELQSALRTLKEQAAQRGDRALACQTLANMQWHEVDEAPLRERLAGIAEQLELLRRGNAALQEAGRRLDEKRQLLAGAVEALQDQQVTAREVRREIEMHTQRLASLRASADAAVLPEAQRTELEARFAAGGRPGTHGQEAPATVALTLENLDKVAGLVERQLNEELKAHEAERQQLVRTIEDRFAEFRRRWPSEGGDLDDSLAGAPDFLAMLTRLEEDGLPAYEKRFFELLQSQSHQNLASLSTHLQQAQREIRDRMELVNESLAQAQFNTGTHLRIDVTDRQLAEVREFRAEIKQVLSHAFTEDREVAEQRFKLLREVVERLRSQELEHKRWRELVLDVRLHVEFIGREFDTAGAELEVYRSGAGKSGGQRQKLATTCLAAALRYQLGGSGQEVPVYAPVVLDEAFDKADNEFTELAMNIFVAFGFQMIVATPLKSVMTLEPFIGGACFIDISDRRRSTALHIEYDESRQRLSLPEQARGDAALTLS